MIPEKEVADSLELTPQAITEYIKELVAEGLVATDGRMRCRITREGVERLLECPRILERLESEGLKYELFDLILPKM